MFNNENKKPCLLFGIPLGFHYICKGNKWLLVISCHSTLDHQPKKKSNEYEKNPLLPLGNDHRTDTLSTNRV